MAITQQHSFDQATRENDYVRRMQLMNAAQESPKAVYRHTEVEVEDGPLNEQTRKRPMSRIRLKYALDQQFIFAIYAEHPAFHTRGRDEWNGVATNAINKFASMKGLQIKAGPHPEPGVPYNMMAELDKAIEIAPETKAKLDQQDEEIAALQELKALEKRLAALRRG